MRQLFIIVVAASLLAGCGYVGVHKIDIQQGNVITQEGLAKVKEGMTKAEVKNALGSPLLTDVFHGDRWDYFFSNAKGGRELEKHRVTLYFKEERLAKIEGTAPPTVTGEARK